MKQMKNTQNSIYGLKTMMDLFGIGPVAGFSILISLFLISFLAGYFFITSAPPSRLTIMTGPEGSTFHKIGQKYADGLAKHGVKVQVLTSEGSLDNLKRISDPKSKVDLALVQGGLFDDEVDLDKLVSLGSIRHQPIFFFYRGTSAERLAQMKGKVLAIGPEGSGTNILGRKLLALNDIDDKADNSTKFLTLDSKSATEALLNGKIDGAFMMSGYSSLSDMRKLMVTEGIQLMSFRNAAAYTRKIDFLHILDLPEGVIDFARNIPPQNVKLIGPMAELISTTKLHPAMTDLILDVARSIHGSSGMFQKHAEFPAPIAHHIKLSEDAEHFYKSGKTFLYRYLPFWLASLIGRLFVIFLPVLIVIIPLFRSTPAILRWLGELRIRRRYRALLKLEEEIKNEVDEEKLSGLYKEFEDIDHDVRNMRVRPAFAEQFYFLRVHIDYVRRLIARK
jgi:hypothetical protein